MHAWEAMPEKCPSPWNEALRQALVVFIYRKVCTLMFCYVQIKPSLKLGLGLGLFPWKGKGRGWADGSIN